MAYRPEWVEYNISIFAKIYTTINLKTLQILNDYLNSLVKLANVW